MRSVERDEAERDLGGALWSRATIGNRVAMEDEAARAAFGSARVATLGTVDSAGRPHLVPIVFALEGDTVYSAVDRKPKRTTRLRRLVNVEANPEVVVLADHYDDRDWSRLWWARGDGSGRVLAGRGNERAHALALLVSRYSQYRDSPPEGPVLAVDVERWSGWGGGS